MYVKLDFQNKKSKKMEKEKKKVKVMAKISYIWYKHQATDPRSSAKPKLGKCKEKHMIYYSYNKLLKSKARKSL